MIPALIAVLACLGPAPAATVDEKQSVPLSQAILAFNARAAEDPIGNSQPPLTEEEVLAAIRWWGFRREKAPVTDAQFAELQDIVRTKRFPAGTEFEVLRGFQPTNEGEFTAWSVRIRMPHGLGTYAYVIRERMVSWRPIGPEERAVWTGGIGAESAASNARSTSKNWRTPEDATRLHARRILVHSPVFPARKGTRSRIREPNTHATT